MMGIQSLYFSFNTCRSNHCEEEFMVKAKDRSRRSYLVSCLAVVRPLLVVNDEDSVFVPLVWQIKALTRARPLLRAER